MKKRFRLSLILVLAVALATGGAQAAGSGLHSFSIVPITLNTATLAQCGLSSGYQVVPAFNCCDETTCLGFPMRLLIATRGERDRTMMIYYTGESFIERVRSNVSLFTHRDGALDPELGIFQLKYMDAAGYCDAQARRMAGQASFLRNEDLSFYDSRLAAHQKEFYQEIAPIFAAMGNTLEWYRVTAANRVYTYTETDGTPFALNIMAEVRAYQYTTRGYGVQATNIIWDAPEYYLMICPLADYEKQRDSVFRIFTENTTVNDQYKALLKKLDFQIRDNVIRNMNMTVAASSAYAAIMTDLTFSMVEGAMNRPSYSSDRFSDYLFDRNDYTLSDGSSVKISTGYSYVYEGDNGTVYYTDSALNVPGGATRLVPNR